MYYTIYVPECLPGQLALGSTFASLHRTPVPSSPPPPVCSSKAAYREIAMPRIVAREIATSRIVAQKAFSAEAHNITEGRPSGATADQRLRPLGPIGPGPVEYAFVTNDADHSETPLQVSEN